MLKQVMAALLATVAFTPAAQAQDGEQEGRSPGMSRRSELREMRQRVADEQGQRPQFQRPAEAPRQEQRNFEQPRVERPAEQPRPAQQAQGGRQGGWQDRNANGYDPGQGRGNMFAERAQRQQADQQARGQAQVDARQRDTGRDWRQGGWQRGDGGRDPGQADQRRADDVRRVEDARRADQARRDNDNRRFDNQRQWNATRGWDTNSNRAGDNNDRGWANGRRYQGSNNWNNGRDDWSRRWRDDNRFDWGRYRQQNRNLFRLPRYYAPYNWNYGYRRFSIGVTLFSGLWDQDYWIDDPWYYRLPPAYGPYRWVRYYNDALLVDIRTGYVVDTVYDIFY